MKAELSPDLAPAPVPLDDKLNEVAREERQRALRGLLQTPLLTADGTHAAEFGLVRRHADELRDWLAHHANWTLQVTSELARLRKTPPDSTDCTRAARDVRTDAPFTRSRYVLLCLALAALERSERQTTLGRLAEAMLGFFTADPSSGGLRVIVRPQVHGSAPRLGASHTVLVRSARALAQTGR